MERLYGGSMRKLVIDRAKWQCAGHEVGETLLLNDYGKMCCLGFHALAIGCSKSKVLWISEPCSLVGEYKRPPKGLPVIEDDDGCYDNAPWVDDAIAANDHIEDDAERESKIASIFKAQGWEVEFVGEYPK
jgi:hypothetical protein